MHSSLCVCVCQRHPSPCTPVSFNPFQLLTVDAMCFHKTETLRPLLTYLVLWLKAERFFVLFFCLTTDISFFWCSISVYYCHLAKQFKDSCGMINSPSSHPVFMRASQFLMEFSCSIIKCGQWSDSSVVGRGAGRGVWRGHPPASCT